MGRKLLAFVMGRRGLMKEMQREARRARVMAQTRRVVR